MAGIYGIDLGTTYSCIARIDERGKPVVVANSEGELTTPSVVYFESEDSRVVGNSAKEEAELNPDRVISVVKQQMGTDWTTEQFGKEYTAPAVSAFILEKLVRDAEESTGDDITEAVITCPAYFGVTERQATREAGELAGLSVEYVIPEPTAAAFAYGFDQESTDQTLLVYDLGGGTFDVTVLRVEQHQIKVVCTGGDHSLGGKDWDTTIAEWVAQEFSRETDADFDNLRDDAETWEQLLSTAEIAKLALSSKQKTVRRIRIGVDRIALELTRDRFDELTRHHLLRTLSLTADVLETARSKGCRRMDKVLLVGGSTYMPQVKETLAGRFDCDVRLYDPNQAVAKGAALMALKMAVEGMAKPNSSLSEAASVISSLPPLAGAPAASDSSREMRAASRLGLSLPAVEKISHTTILNVSSKSFGVVVKRPSGESGVNNLITIDDPIPKEIWKTYQTTESGQRGVKIVCVENAERLGPQDGAFDYHEAQKIGQVKLRLKKPLPRGSEVDVRFSLGEDGQLEVLGRNPQTGEEIEAKFVSNALLDEEDEVEERESLTVYLVFDLSYSMQGKPLREAKRAAHGFLERLDLGHCSIGVIVFSDNTRTILRASQDQRQIDRTIDGMYAGDGGGGNLATVFDEIQRRLSGVEGRRFAIVLTDGYWRRPKEAIHQAHRCHSEGIEVIAIGFGSADEEFLRAIATTDELSLHTQLNKLVDTFSNIAEVLTETGGEPRHGGLRSLFGS